MDTDVSDRDLASLAGSGDPAALGSLLARHRAGMMAVALSVLRDPQEAEDAVQDAALTAVTHIGDLRDAGAAGPWLRMIVRNCCRMRLRARVPVPVEKLTVVSGTGTGDPQDRLEQHAMRDWVSHAVAELSPPLRVTAMLRYFSSITSYEEIAAVCGIPTGTVRRRLHAARHALYGRLLSSADGAYDGAGDLSPRRREAEHAVTAGHQGTFGDFLRDGWHPDVDTAWAGGRSERGIDPLVEVMDTSMAAGMRQRVAGVSASREVVLWEIDVQKPGAIRPDCPPYAYWLLFYDQGRVRRLRLFHRQGLPPQRS